MAASRALVPWLFSASAFRFYTLPLAIPRCLYCVSWLHYTHGPTPIPSLSLSSPPPQEVLEALRVSTQMGGTFRRQVEMV